MGNLVRLLVTMLLVLFVAILVVGCGGAGESNDNHTASFVGGGEGEEGDDEYYVSANARKGPFDFNSDVHVNALNADGTIGTEIAHVQTTDSRGSFEFETEPGIYYVAVTGTFFNELNRSAYNGMKLEAIFATEDETDNELSVNLLTHLAKNRIIYLYSELGLPIKDAIDQAQREVVKAFNSALSIEPDAIEDFTTLNIYDENGATGNGYLLALGAGLLKLAEIQVGEGQHEDGRFSTIVNNLIRDLAEDGVIDFVEHENFSAELRNALGQLDVETIEENLEEISRRGYDKALPVADIRPYLPQEVGHDIRVNDFDINGSYKVEPGETISFNINIMNVGSYDENVLVDIEINGPNFTQEIKAVELTTIKAGYALPQINRFAEFTVPIDAPVGNYSVTAKAYGDLGDEMWQDNSKVDTFVVGEPENDLLHSAYRYISEFLPWQEDLSLPDELSTGGYGWYEFEGYKIAFSPYHSESEARVHIVNSDGVTLESSRKIPADRLYLFDNNQLMVKYDHYAAEADGLVVEFGINVPDAVNVSPLPATSIVNRPVQVRVQLPEKGACCFNDEIYAHFDGNYYLDKSNDDYHNTTIFADGTRKDYGYEFELTPRIAGHHKYVLEVDSENGNSYYVYGELNTLTEAPKRSEGWRYPFGNLEGTKSDDNQYLSPNGEFEVQWSVELPSTASYARSGDVDGDGDQEIVVLSGGEIRFYNSDGTTAIPTITTNEESTQYLILENVDNTPGYELIVGSRSTSSMKVKIYKSDGTLLNTLNRSGGVDSSMWPVAYLGDNRLAVGYSSGFARQPRGTAVWDLTTQNELWHHAIGPCLSRVSVAEVSGNGVKSLLPNTSTCHNGNQGKGVNGTGTLTTDGDLYTILVNEHGEEQLVQMLGADTAGGANGGGNQILTDLEGDGEYEIVAQVGHYPIYYPGDGQIRIISLDGSVKHQVSIGYNSNPDFLVSDLDNDGRKEIVVWSNETKGLYVFNSELEEVVSRSIDTTENIYGHVAVDVDGDGVKEILVSDGRALRILISENLELLWEMEMKEIISSVFSMGVGKGQGVDVYLILKGDLVLVSGG